MHIDDERKFLLFMEPKMEDRSAIPMDDEFTMIMRVACQEAKFGVSNYGEPMQPEPTFTEGVRYKGVHTNCDNITSTNYDLLLPTGHITNSLCVHYLMYFRKAIGKNDWDKIKEIQRHYGRVQDNILLKKGF